MIILLRFLKWNRNARGVVVTSGCTLTLNAHVHFFFFPQFVCVCVCSEHRRHEVQVIFVSKPNTHHTRLIRIIKLFIQKSIPFLFLIYGEKESKGELYNAYDEAENRNDVVS